MKRTVRSMSHRKRIMRRRRITFFAALTCTILALSVFIYTKIPKNTKIALDVQYVGEKVEILETPTPTVIPTAAPTPTPTPNPDIVSTSVITWMNYSSITSRSSAQYRLKESSKKFVDSKGRYNILIDDKPHLVIAVGQGWGYNIGDTIVVEIKGKHYDAVIGDFKSKSHTNCETITYNGIKYPKYTVMSGGHENGKYHSADYSVIEIIGKGHILKQYTKGNLYNSIF